jgi:hypothetical protein
VRPPMVDGGSACTLEEGTVLPFYSRVTLVKAVRKSLTTARRSMGATWRRAWGKVRQGERRHAGDRRQWHKAARRLAGGETPHGTDHGPLCVTHRD